MMMRGPNGEEMPQHGVYLEVIAREKIVFTDAYELKAAILAAKGREPPSIATTAS